MEPTMAELPKIDSEGLRLAKKAGSASVSSVVRVSKTDGKARCDYCDGKPGPLARTPQGDLEEQPCPKCLGVGYVVAR
jgi:hypothetical protein